MENKDTTELLKEIRDNQKLQLDRQQEALAIQKEQFELYKDQLEKTRQIQDRAEKLQDKSAQIISGARKLFVLVVPIIILMILYLTWIIFR